MELTDAEIDELEAGRELDYLIAERVMGVEYAPSKPHLDRHKLAYERRQNGDTFKAIADDFGISPSRVQQIVRRWKHEQKWSIPHFSTTWEGAGLVFDKLAEAHDFMRQWYEIGYWSWEIGELNEGVYTKIAEAIGETLPLAICRAALKVAKWDRYRAALQKLSDKLP